MERIEGSKSGQITVDGIIEALANGNRNYLKWRAETKEEFIVRQAINRIAVTLLSRTPSQFLCERMREKLGEWAPIYDVDPNDLSRNLSTSNQ